MNSNILSFFDCMEHEKEKMYLFFKKNIKKPAIYLFIYLSSWEFISGFYAQKLFNNLTHLFIYSVIAFKIFQIRMYDVFLLHTDAIDE